MMETHERINTKKLERALEEIRKDVATLHRDLGHAFRNEARWLGIIMLSTASHLLRELVGLSISLALLIVCVYFLIDAFLIFYKASSKEEPIERVRDIKIDLS